LRVLFARYGLPRHVVSDNGPQFRSEEFTLFLKLPYDINWGSK